MKQEDRQDGDASHAVERWPVSKLEHCLALWLFGRVLVDMII